MRTEIDHMREALASYIEVTYHLSSPKVVELRAADARLHCPDALHRKHACLCPQIVEMELQLTPAVTRFSNQSQRRR